MTIHARGFSRRSILKAAASLTIGVYIARSIHVFAQAAPAAGMCGFCCEGSILECCDNACGAGATGCNTVIGSDCCPDGGEVTDCYID